MSDPPCLLFDVDGCIIDSLPSIVRCWEETLPEFGLPVPSLEVMRAHVGPPVDESARFYAPEADEATITRIVRTYRARSARAEDIEPFPGMPELLSGLHGQGAILGIATSKSLEVLEPTLDRLDLRRYFSVIEGTRREELGTDKTTIVRRAMAGLAPRLPAALVGDREHDVIGAHANGIPAIGVLWGYSAPGELEAAGADMVVRIPADLDDYLTRELSQV